MAIVGQTLTPAGGNSPQSLQTQSLQDTLKSIGTLAPPQRQTANAAIQTVQDTGQTLAQKPQVMQQSVNTLGQEAGFDQVNRGMSDLQKQYALFQHDMQMAGSMPPGTTAVPQNMAPTVPTNAQGGSTLSPSMVGDVIGTGYQFGQSNPYSGITYANNAENEAFKAALGLLTGANNFNVGQAGTTLGQIKDVFSTQEQQQKNALDVINAIVSAKQREQEMAQTGKTQQLDVIKTLGDLGYDVSGMLKGLGVDIPQGTSPMTNSVDSYVSMIKNGSYKISNVPEKLRTAVTNKLSAEGIDLNKASQLSDLQDAENVIAQAKDLFYASGRTGGIAEGPLKGTLEGIGAKIGMGANKDAINTYESFRQGIASTLRDLVKQTGALSTNEVARLTNLLPSTTDDPKVAENKFNNALKLIQDKRKSSVIPSSSTSNTKQTTGKVKVISPDGQTGTIDASELDAALAAGWKKAQ